ncbi:hypothetical protein [Aliivibrio fischeri]|uniref:F4 family fimbrial subunit n=1 Tax=Aliivibrio fischeri TaxID=668 RepID=UPI0014804286|nr:hypothetical protein [Aliivibrio fischeri]
MAKNTQFILPNDMQFTGTVINTAPNWMWQVGPAANAWASNWDINSAEGIERNGETVFTYNERNSKGRTAFVQGYTKTPAATGGAGLAPIVSITSVDGKGIVLNGNTTPQRIDIAATGRLYGGATTFGVLSLVIESSIAASYKKAGDASHWYMENYKGSIGWAAASLIIENDGNSYANVGPMKAMYRDVSYDILSVLQGKSEPNAHTVMGAFTSHLGKVETRWTTVPQTWNAALIAQVKIQ